MNADSPLPPHVDLERVGEVWRIDYEARFREARAWAAEHDLAPAAKDARRVCLLLVDVQNTFCTPGFELFVTGRSGTGALDDNRRLCDFVYRNLAAITQAVVTLDTHQAFQIFHAPFLVDADGRHPDPYTLVSPDGCRRRALARRSGRGRGVGLEPVADTSTCAPTSRRSRRAGSTTSRSGPSTPCSAGSATLS